VSFWCETVQNNPEFYGFQETKDLKFGLFPVSY
jgi:hypothetical protein